MKQAEKTLEFYKIKEQLKRYTACSLGKTRIDALSPFTDVVLLRRALAKTDEAMRLVNAYGPLGLGGLTDMSHALAKADMDGRLLPEELLRLVGLIDCVAHVLNYAKESQLDTPLFQADCAQLAVCHSLKREIERCISPEGEIVDHASPELARIRKAIRQTESQVRSKMNHYLISEKEHLAENIITMRNDRFVIPVKMGYQNQVRGIVHAQSASKQTAYIEPEAVVILNNQIQQLKSEEQDEMDRILFVLSQEVKKQAEKLRDQQEILGELDFIFAKGRYGHEHDCVIAEISDDYQYFCLKQARHPLIDAKRVVANTLELVLPQHILMITGSNTGGKTVNLKTAGLLSLMSLCGLAIPAQEAKIPFFDEIYVDLGDEQSIEQSLSTFSGHLSKLVEITDHVTNQSLVLIDEVGSGTDPQEGQSIAQAILEYLHEYRCMTIATTHYSSLKRHAKLTDYILLASVAFDEEKFAPTYHLILGESGRSYALEISKRLGLKDTIIKRAQAIKEENQSTEEKLLERLEIEKKETRLLQESYTAKLQEVEQLRVKWQHRQDVFDREKQRYLDEAQTKANLLVDQAKAEIDLLLQKFKDQGKEMKMHEIIETRHQLDALKKEKEMPILKGDENHAYAVGDIVMILSMNREAEVTEVKRNELLVNLGGLKMQLKKDEVAFVRKKQKKKVLATRGHGVKKTGSYEINVIGMRYEEAMLIVDKFIDDALVSGYPSVRIVHGMGTGALRNGVQQLLKRHAHIASYRSGGPQEGGLGVTLAYFK